MLESKSKWTKIPRSIRDRINEMLLRQRYALAYHYMDFHHIQYDDKSKKVFGMCYFKNQVILKMELRTEYFRDKECPQKVEFQAALDAPNTLINCRIGKSGLLTRSKRSGSKIRSKENRRLKKLKLDENNKFKKGPQTLKYQEQKHYPGLKYYQGKKNLCFQYCFKSALFYHMQRKCRENKGIDKEIYYGMVEDITNTETISRACNSNNVRAMGSSKGRYLKIKGKMIESHNTFDAMKKIMDAYKWDMKRIDKTLFMSRRFDAGWATYFEKNQDDIFVLQLLDRTVNNNHWIAVTHNLLFNSNWTRTCAVTLKNIDLCCGNDSGYDKFGKVYCFRKKN